MILSSSLLRNGLLVRGCRTSFLVRYRSRTSARTTTTTTTTSATNSRSSSSSVKQAQSTTDSNNNNNNDKSKVVYLWAAAVAATTTAAGVAFSVRYFHNHFGGTEGLYRAARFYSYAIPRYLVYRYHQYRQSPQEDWNRLDRETSAVALQLMLELKGFYIKCGQTCATNIGDAFPVIWQETMAPLQDQVPPEDFENVILPILNSEYNGKVQDIFASIDPDPIGSASIGQVHRAQLRLQNNNNNDDSSSSSSNTTTSETICPVVVKICYPHVERLLRGDVRTVKAFAEVAQPVHVPALNEIEKQFQTEFDYTVEAEHLQVVRDNLTRAGLAGPGKICVVPKPYQQYCTKKVLVMEELEGEKLAVALKRDSERWAALTGQTVAQLRQQAASRSAAEIQKWIAAADAQRRARNTWKRLYNATVAIVPGVKKKEYHSKAELPLNHAKLVDDLIYIHGYEVLHDGRFNADCHPGNILLCRDKDGSPQLGLIDYGQVQVLNKEQRHLFCRIIIALVEDDRQEIVRLMKEAGYKSERMDPDVIYKYAKVGYDEDNKQLTDGRHIQVFMEDLQAKDPIINLPQPYIMVARTSTFLRGLAHALKQSRSVAKIWKPIAERVLAEDL